ncbi:MAG: hypothetical protein N3D11_12740 [Candidatus Sumerlaeia bacterium]|nr:hypothetical protein [Candidatus Sumerlaeia bacterium]
MFRFLQNTVLSAVLTLTLAVWAYAGEPAKEAAPAGEKAAVAAKNPARTLTFPSAAIGKVMVREQGVRDPKAWKEIGPAQGEVKVPEGHDVLLKIVGDAAKDLKPLASLKPNDLDILDLGGTPVTDEGLAIVGKLTGLRGLYLGQTAITDTGLAHLKGLTSLEHLKLTRTQISEEGVKNLANLKALKSLTISKVRLGDPILEPLKGLTNLETLNLRGTLIKGEGLANLKDLPKLRALYLSRAKLTPDSYATIGAMKNLVELDLSHTRTTDAGLAQLKDLSNLRRLELGSTQITTGSMPVLLGFKSLKVLSLRANKKFTNSAVKDLKQITTLESLDIRGVKMTAPAVEELRAALPKCKVLFEIKK